jgi:hypothetical protein
MMPRHPKLVLAVKTWVDVQAPPAIINLEN